MAKRKRLTPFGAPEAEDLPEIEARAVRFWADGQAPAPYVRRYRRKDGSALWAKVSSSRIPATAEQPELVMALAYLVPANSLLSVSPYRAMVQRGDATQISF